jgi:hypothetical protein
LNFYLSAAAVLVVAMTLVAVLRVAAVVVLAVS